MGKRNVTQQQELHIGQASFTNLPHKLLDLTIPEFLHLSPPAWYFLPAPPEERARYKYILKHIGGTLYKCNVCHGIKYLQTNEIKLNYKHLME